MTEDHSAATTFPVAELERRFYAFALDRLLVWGLVALAGAGAWLVLEDVRRSAGVAAVMLVASWLVVAVVAGVNGTTPGKAMVGLRIVHHGSGTPIGVGRSLLRSIVLALATVPTFAIGLATLAWTAVEDRGRQRRGWHDHLAHSVVVDVRPVDDQVDDVDDAPRHVVNLTAMRLIPAPPLEPPTPPRRTNTDQSTRRTPPPQTDRSTSTPRPDPTPHAAPHPAPPPVLPGSVPPSQPWSAAPPDGRTAVRPVPGSATPGPRWRVTFDDAQTFVVEGLTLVGRRPEPRSGEQVHHLVPLVSTDMSVSKTHAQFGPASDGVLVVMDRGSTNGSVLIRQGVSRPLSPGKPTTLVDGDTVSFGDRQMSVRREG